MVLVKEGIPRNLSIPDNRELQRGTLRHLIRVSGLTRAEFMALLDR